MKNTKHSHEDEEIWKEIQGFEGLYAVSNRGRVMNLESGKVLKPQVNNNGYERVCLVKNKKRKKCYIHKLVANAFIENPNNLVQVNHIDENKRNNNVNNLNWMTASQNTIYSSHKRSCKVNQLTLDGQFIKEWKSFNEIERETGFNKGSINMCCKGRKKKAYDFKWEYVDGLHQQKNNRPVIALSEEDEFIAQFRNVPEASRCLGIITRLIYYALKGVYKTTHGFKFKYADEI